MDPSGFTNPPKFLPAERPSASQEGLCSVELLSVITFCCKNMRSRDSLVGISTDYGLDGRGPIPLHGQSLSLPHSVQSCSRTHPASYPVGTWGSFPMGKAARAWSWHPSSAEVKMVELYLHSPVYLHGIVVNCRSQWPRGLRHELSSVARTLGSWIRIPFEARMSLCAFILCLCCSVCR
jgi:hypothetical protein